MLETWQAHVGGVRTKVKVDLRQRMPASQFI
jgi:hypothetical protein